MVFLLGISSNGGWHRVAESLALPVGATAEEAGHGLGKFTGKAHLVFVHAPEGLMTPSGDAEDDFEQEVIGKGSRLSSCCHAEER
jgi:hypothetical protein